MNTTPDSLFQQQQPSRMGNRRNRPKKKMSKGKKALWISLSVFLIMVLAAGGVVGAYMLQLKNSFDQAETLELADVFPKEESRPEVLAPEAQNILLLGSDTRGEVGDDLDDIRGQRSDTIILMHIPEDRESIEAVSFMRDLYVDIPGHGTNKINAALAFGGVPLLVQTLENMLGVRIDRVAIIDFEGFKGLTNALGGVTLNNPEAFQSRGHSFAEGDISMNGEQALEFVRARYPFADGDYTRVKNQQRYLGALIKQIFSRDTLTNPVLISNAVSKFSPYLSVDAGFDVGYITDLGISLRNLDSDSFNFSTAPTLGTGMEGSQSVVYADWDNIALLGQNLQNDTMEQYVPTGR